MNATTKTGTVIRYGLGREGTVSQREAVARLRAGVPARVDVFAFWNGTQFSASVRRPFEIPEVLLIDSGAVSDADEGSAETLALVLNAAAALAGAAHEKARR